MELSKDPKEEEVKSKYLTEDLPTDWKEQFFYGTKLLIFTYTPVVGMLDSNWASFEKKKNIENLPSLFETSKYRFDKMDTEELVEVFAKELSEFIAGS